MKAILDQIQIIYNTVVANFGTSENPKYARTFTPTKSGGLYSIVTFLGSNGSPTDEVKMEIYKDNAGALGDFVSAAHIPLDVTRDLPYTFVFFLDKVHIHAGTTYQFILSRTGALSEIDNYKVWGGVGLGAYYSEFYIKEGA